MARTLVALFDERDRAREAVRSLVDRDFPRQDISLAARTTEGEIEPFELEEDRHTSMGKGAGVGALSGGALGALVGLLAGSSVWIGPAGTLLAVGPLASTLIGAGIGAAGGGLVGSMVALGVPEAEAEAYEQAVHRGDIVLLLRTTDERAREAAQILDRHGPVDVGDRPAVERPQAAQESEDHEVGKLHLTSGPMGAGVPEPSGGHPIDPQHAGEQPGLDLGPEEQAWRTHYLERYAGTGNTWPQYEVGYRFGRELGVHDRYRTRSWDEVEPQARMQWEREHGRASWETVRGSVSYAFERARRQREKG